MDLDPVRHSPFSAESPSIVFVAAVRECLTKARAGRCRGTEKSRIIRAFSRYCVRPEDTSGQTQGLSNGGDSTAARRREQAPLLSRGGGRFAARGVGQVHRAAGLLRPEGAARPRGAAGQHGAGQTLDRSGRAALADGEAPRAPVCKESRLTGWYRWAASPVRTACAVG